MPTEATAPSSSVFFLMFVIFSGAAQLSLGGTASESIGEPLVYMPDGITARLECSRKKR